MTNVVYGDAENIPKSPQAMGYMTYSEWADEVEEEFQTLIDKMVSVGDYSAATYYKLVLREHREEVAKQKKSYNGL